MLKIDFLNYFQSPLIDQIEYYAHQATLNVDKGAGKLEKAREMKIKRLKVYLHSIDLSSLQFTHMHCLQIFFFLFLFLLFRGKFGCYFG